MKTNTNATRTLRVLLVLGILSCASFIKAQPNCNMTIINNLDCDVLVAVDFYESTPSCVACVVSGVQVSVLANSTAPLICTNSSAWGCTSAVCDVIASLVGAKATSGAVPYGTGPTALTYAAPNCNASAGPTIDVTANTIVISK
jgi:hypothetical protein